MVKTLSILGSTGSIGVQALEVCEAFDIKVEALIAGSNIKLLEQQIRKFNPQFAAVLDIDAANKLEDRISDTRTKVLKGEKGIQEAVTLEKADTLLTSVVGIAGLIPTLKAIEAGKNIALSNKETLVTAGSIVMEAARKKQVQILPVDSEHSAIFQCLNQNRPEDVEKIILTASGGPFKGYSAHQLQNVNLEQALKHPNWSMGSKITIDSATLMNKGLEVIEAMWLFSLPINKIEVLIHTQSVIHSMVEYKDGSVMAQLGAPDMRIPIQLALSWPERLANNFKKLSLTSVGTLTFEKPDMETFKCLKLAFEAAKIGGTMPAAMNAANEIAVSLFLDKKISFTGISELVEKTMLSHSVNSKPVLHDIIDTDHSAREHADRLSRTSVF